ncbi:PREDICTED: reversion-inducing cysteine-rich protein with Kazal motifs-like isoform X2 [Branchiostoma belcheri]|uniref:Reversion-inducing cysteine-rich protein with Kazal motifs n=1 Tax=Branchiostoma belcheri TaxID=7741 RepID=A0A6P4Z1L2_BRABE|nr:PREDICTED: reversion-inducing cysteine-rich protein with Kazal motifs-like isoform X2 [Branchiostoma belcheri]
MAFSRDMILLSFAVVVVCVLTAAQDTYRCCYQAREYPSCRAACEQMAAEIDHDTRIQHVMTLPRYCRSELVGFWQCVNTSVLGEPESGGEWVGHACCDLTVSDLCKTACLEASSSSDISAIPCRRDLEPALHSCIERNERRHTWMGERCCGTSVSAECEEACSTVFQTDSTPTRQQRQAIQDHCLLDNQQVIQCVDNYTNSRPANNPAESVKGIGLHCCEQSNDEQCQDRCRRVLVTLTSEQEIVDGLIEGCGDPLPQDPLWQCFLSASANNGHDTEEVIPVTGLDGAKLQCCSKAATSRCRDLCVKLYSTTWATSSSWNQFYADCQYHPSEEVLMQCIADVQEPCQLGCSELNFCTNFNNRPTELFRSCASRSDEDAEQYMSDWQGGVISMPVMTIPVRDVQECEPDMWKAIACTLQIKPCHSQSHGNRICKADCVNILTRCGDQARFPLGTTVDSLCNALSPQDEDDHCITLAPYLVPSQHISRLDEVTNPCNPSPCMESVCHVNRARENCTGSSCPQHICKQGCPMGEASDYVVAAGAVVRVPVASGDPGCYRVCHCGDDRRLGDCTTLSCIPMDTCLVGGQIRDHGTSFEMDCNICACFAGELTCTKRPCLSLSSSEEERRRYTGLPCNCADQFVPVCAHNGRTYPSACLARCAGLLDHQFEFGTCSSLHPCQPDPCPASKRCIPRPKVCLNGLDQQHCQQYQCVPRSCEGEMEDPVCDVDGVQHPNYCQLLVAGKQLGYHAPCHEQCKASPVCGHNGETYESNCAAHAARVSIDYEGPCLAVGLRPGQGKYPECSTVSCPDSSLCEGIIPPGACCPVCGGVLAMLYSGWYVDLVSRQASIGPITVTQVIQQLRNHVSVPQCDVFGYLSIEGDIIAIVMPVTPNTTPLQVEACNQEAQKLGALINSGSPVIVSHVPLSFLTSASLHLAAVTMVSSATAAVPSLTALLLLCLGTVLHRLFHAS